MLKGKIKESPPDCRKQFEYKSDCAVSPVVGVMLMLVVTIIIAAVVSGFAGGLIESGGQKTPSLAMDVQIANSGNYRGSEFSATVTGVSEPIHTSDLKIITSWTTTVKTNGYKTTQSSYMYLNGTYEHVAPGTVLGGKGCILGLPLGTVYHGGAECMPGVSNSYTGKNAISVAPYGFGPGVTNTTTSDIAPSKAYDTSGPTIPMYNWQFFSVTHFGNYSLEQGTVMLAEAAGRCIKYPVTGGKSDYFNGGGYGTLSQDKVTPNPYMYLSDGGVYKIYTGNETVPMDIIADGGWENLRGGDVVNVKIVFTPSGKTIFDQDVVVDYS
jgi:FlaG/FlaF family flagellin (archaellin)